MKYYTLTNYYVERSLRLSAWIASPPVLIGSIRANLFTETTNDLPTKILHTVIATVGITILTLIPTFIVAALSIGVARIVRTSASFLPPVGLAVLSEVILVALFLGLLYLAQIVGLLFVPAMLVLLIINLLYWLREYDSGLPMKKKRGESQ